MAYEVFSHNDLKFATIHVGREHTAYDYFSEVLLSVPYASSGLCIIWRTSFHEYIVFCLPSGYSRKITAY